MSTASRVGLPSDDDHEHRFWDRAATMLRRPGVSRSTMMGLPCLRLHGSFFASFDRRTGDLLVKLTETRVDALVGAAAAHHFAPAGRRFREWAAIPSEHDDTWSALMEEALEHVASAPAVTSRRSRTR